MPPQLATTESSAMSPARMPKRPLAKHRRDPRPLRLDPAAAENAAPRHRQVAVPAHLRSGLRRPSGRRASSIATDHAEIARDVERFGGEVVMTSPDCQSGTDRVAEVGPHDCPHAEILVNVQGDEPEISPDAIDRVIELMEHESDRRHGDALHADPHSRTARQPGLRQSRLRRRGRALYFSRSPIPFVRDSAERATHSPSTQPPIFFQHLGLYAYRRDDAPRSSPRSPPSSLEQCEKLEQLRLLQAGGEILIDVVEHAASGIDTPADYAAFVARQRKKPLAA